MAKRIASGLQPILTGIFQGISQGMSNYDTVQNVARDANRTPTSHDQAMGVGEGEDYVTGQSGTQYQLPKMGWGTQFTRGQANAGLHYMLTGDASQAVQYAAQREQDAHDIYYRAKNEAAKLDAKGYPPENIQQWIMTGDPAALTRNLGNRAEEINGKLTMMTAEQAQAHENAVQNQANANREFDFRGQEAQRAQTNADRQFGLEQARFAQSAANMADERSIRHQELQMRQDELAAKQGQSPQQQQSQRAAEEIGTHLTSVPDDVISSFTGGAVKFSNGGHVAQLKANNAGGETKKAFDEGKRIEGLAKQRAVAAAKAAGQSGLNTIAELEQAGFTVPQLDYTSEQAYKESAAAIVDYLQGGTGVRQASTDHLSDEDLLKRYGG